MRAYSTHKLSEIERQLNALKQAISVTNQSSPIDADSLVDALTSPTKPTSKVGNPESTLHISKEFKAELDKSMAFDNWVDEMKKINSYMSFSNKETHTEYIQKLIDEGDFVGVILKSFIHSISIKGPKYWDDVVEELKLYKKVKQEDSAHTNHNLINRAIIHNDTSGSTIANALSTSSSSNQNGIQWIKLYSEEV